MQTKLYSEAHATLTEIIERAGLTDGSILVIGCSTSEILGARIGTNSAPEVAAEIFSAFADAAAGHFALGRKGTHVRKSQQCGEHVVDTALGSVKARVKRDRRHTAQRQLEQLARHAFGGGQLLYATKK